MELRRYLALARRWAWLIVLAVIVSAGTSYIVSRNTPPVYSASTHILIDEAPGSNVGNEYAQILLEQQLTTTYIQLLKTRPVLEEVVQRLQLPFDAGTLGGRISVSSPTDTQILVVSVEDNQPQRAADIANTLAAVFAEENQKRQSARYAESVANREALQEQLTTQVRDLEVKINAFPEPQSPEAEADLSNLQTQLGELQSRYTLNFNELENLRVTQQRDVNNLIVVEPAVPPGGPVRPRTMQNTLLAAVVGAMMAGGIIFLIEYLDDTIKSPDDIQLDTGLSTLGVIATIQGKSEPEMMVVQHSPRAPISEAFRILRTNLSFASIDEGLKSIMVTSPSPGDGKSTIVGNLSVALAQAGNQVIVVDSDLRKPTQHKYFALANNQGLTTALLDAEASVSQHLQDSRVPGIRVLTSGPLPPNPSELLNSQRMSAIVAALKEAADIVIFDTPPTLVVADATVLGAKVDGSILVAQVGKTRRNALARAAEALLKADATIFGVVLNRLQPKRSGYYDYYYYYQYYSYDYSRRKPGKSKTTRLPGWLSGLSDR